MKYNKKQKRAICYQPKCRTICHWLNQLNATASRCLLNTRKKGKEISNKTNLKKMYKIFYHQYTHSKFNRNKPAALQHLHKLNEKCL